MKKIIALSLSIVTILFCSWIIVSKIEKLDLVPNYTDSYASENKRKIDQRTDINDCEKKALRSQVDLQQANLREISVKLFKPKLHYLL